MVEANRISLIADSGIQFSKPFYLEINPEERLPLSSNSSLQYDFFEWLDPEDNSTRFDLLYHFTKNGNNLFFRMNELKDGNCFKVNASGRLIIDPESGLPVLKDDEDPSFEFEPVYPDDPGIISMKSLDSFKTAGALSGTSPERLPAYRFLLDKWLPVPMFLLEADGRTADAPVGWCRMKIRDTGLGSVKDTRRFMVILAFDTRTSTESQSKYRPSFDEGDFAPKKYGICNKSTNMISFFSSSRGDRAFADYVKALMLGPDFNKRSGKKYEAVAYYIYFMNFIRCLYNPEVTLYRSPKEIQVDLSLDIGNSRTCGVLFQEGDVFRRAKLLKLRDLTEPWRSIDDITTNNSFDMRLVFHKADFGNVIPIGEDMFRWNSIVRLGEEAKRLSYRSVEEMDTSEVKNNCSSPKRYLWDDRPSAGAWKFLMTPEDQENGSEEDLYLEGISEFVEEDGSFNPDGTAFMSSHYSRRALMLFALVEIFQQAKAQINSIHFRAEHGDEDCRRVLRNIIVTCPGAMSQEEQKVLRICAEDAYSIIRATEPDLPEIRVVPSAYGMKIRDASNPRKEWGYDEASCNQLVYINAERERYGSNLEKLFEMKGHVRPGDTLKGQYPKTLTVGTVDIGAGTTDLMISTYAYIPSAGKIVPVPQFYDSYFVAGDEILKGLIQHFVIEGEMGPSPVLGSIKSALTSRLQNMTDDQLTDLPCLHEDKDASHVYRKYITEITHIDDEYLRKEKLADFAVMLLRDFFNDDTNMQNSKDRRCRNDFNTQVSVPIAQFFLECLQTERPAKTYAFEDIFSDFHPAGYVMDYFRTHFGFDFSELRWRFDPPRVAKAVTAQIETVMKQMSVILFAYHCDIVLMAGRPCTLKPVTELFVKYYPVSPDRLIRLNDYCVGNWYPFANGQGHFYDQKSVVAVGAMVGFIAATKGFSGLVIDFTKMKENIKSTANYIGLYDPLSQNISEVKLDRTRSSAVFRISGETGYIGCKQLNDPHYQARPLYAVYNHNTAKATTLNITVSRDFHEDKEKLNLEDISDDAGNTLSRRDVDFIQQSITDDGSYWLDKGSFKLSN